MHMPSCGSHTVGEHDAKKINSPVLQLVRVLQKIIQERKRAARFLGNVSRLQRRLLLVAAAQLMINVSVGSVV